MLRDVLRAGFFNTPSVDTGLLEVELHRAGDGCAAQARARERRRTVAALDVAVAELDVVLESRH